MRALRWVDDPRPVPAGGCRVYCYICDWEEEFDDASDRDLIDAVVVEHAGKVHPGNRAEAVRWRREVAGPKPAR